MAGDLSAVRALGSSPGANSVVPVGTPETEMGLPHGMEPAPTEGKETSQGRYWGAQHCTSWPRTCLLKRWKLRISLLMVHIQNLAVTGTSSYSGAVSKFFFLMWTIFQLFIEFVTILLLFYVLVFWPQGMWDFNSPTRNRTHTPFHWKVKS